MLSKPDKHSAAAAGLRRDAEERFKARKADPARAQASLGTEALIHELEVHQIELEMQNEALNTSRQQAEALAEKYTDLYDFAPVGYLTLGPDGEIRQLNLAAATLLGAGRDHLVNRRLGQFVSLADRPAFADFLKVVFAGQQPGTCEVSLAEGAPLVVRLDVASRPFGQECLAVLTNITEQKRAEEALRVETVRRILFEQSPDGILIIDPRTGRFLEFNTAAHEGLGYSREEFAQLTLAEVEVLETTLAPAARIADVMQKGRVDFAIRHRTRQGEVRNIHVTEQLLDVEGERHYECVWRDVTELKQTEDALRESEARLRTITDSAQDAILMMTPEGAISYWNPAAERIFGYTSAEAMGQHLHSFLVPSRYHAAHQAALPEFLQTGQGAAVGKTTDLEGRRKDGREISIQLSLSTVQMEGRWHAVGILRDVTEQKEAEAALRQSEARLKRAQQVARLGHWEWDLITKQLDWAEENYRLHGIDPQKVKPSYEAFLQVIDPAEHAFVNKTVAEALAGKASCEFDYTVIRPDNGQRCVIHSKAEVIVDDAGQAVKMVGTVQDITERKRLEARAQQARKVEAIGHLAGGVAHEFNNILAAIIGALELAKLSGSWGEDRELLGVMESSCHRAAGLVKRLLASSSQSVTRPQSLDVAATVAKQLEVLRPLLGEGITLEFNRPPPLSRVRADKVLVEVVVRELCLNAQEAMPSGGVLRVELGEEEVGAERGKSHLDAQAGRFVRLVVRDNGRGMDEQTLKQLFEPFFTTKDVVQGAGLSLATVQGIVRQHHGWVEVESRVGQGSTFRVYLPVEVRERDTTVLARPVAPTLGSRGLVLLAEDDESLRKVTRKLLARMGYQVLEAADGAAALEVWAAHEAEIDMIFTDMVMPGELSGLDVVQQVMGKKPGLKAIITSGYNMEKADLEAARTSGILYLPKPWAFEELAEIMGAMLGSGVAPTSQSNAVRI